MLGLCASLVNVPATVAELVGEWSMDGGLQDSATNAAPNDAAAFTVSGFGTSGADGFGPPDFQDASLFGSSIIAENLGSALRLHENDELGKYQRLWIPDTYFGTAPDYNDNWTVSMWFCRADADNNDFLIYAGPLDGFGDGSPAFQIWINCLDPHPLDTLGVTNYRPTDVAMYSEPITSREWHHMGFVFSENASGTLYLDGQLVATDYQMDVDLALANTGSVFIGGIRAPDSPDHAARNNRSFDGMLDQIMIFDHALTAEEIAALYNDIASLRGDLDGNGAVASRDLDIVRTWWLADVTPGQLDHGDANGDGRVDSQDLDIVRQNWGRSVAGSAVPEPGAWCLLIALGAGLIFGNRRRSGGSRAHRM